jgi:hypothetical protein
LGIISGYIGKGNEKSFDGRQNGAGEIRIRNLLVAIERFVFLV